MFKIYHAYNHGGGDGMVRMDTVYFAEKQDAIDHITGRSEYGGNGTYYEYDVMEHSDLTPAVKFAKQRQEALAKLNSTDKKVLGLE